jgi:hypothetical protein
MPDGSLIKDLMRIYFHQKKDVFQILLFGELLTKCFDIRHRIFIRQKDEAGTFDLYVNSQTLARFFYHVMEIPKSDEEMSVPSWIFTSPHTVKLSYLRSAYDMEGTVLKSCREIRFITKDKQYANDMSRLLSAIGITSTVNPRIGGMHRTRQYRLSVYGKKNFSLFKQVGFQIPHLRDRFRQLLIKNKVV